MRWRNVLMIAQIALSALLLVGAGLMIKSFLITQRFDIGVDTANLVTVQINLPQSRYPQDERVVQTMQYMDYPEAVETMTLEERGGKTTLRTVVLHQSIENRDAHVASGMEGGASASFDQLEAVVRSIS